MLELAPNPYIRPFNVNEMVYHAPISTRHALIYTALTLRAQRAAQEADPSQAICLRSRMYYHRGLAIRALVADISDKDTRNKDTVVASVLSFLVAEVSCLSLLGDWCW